MSTPRSYLVKQEAKGAHMRKRRLLTLTFVLAIAFLLSVPGLALAEQERITSFDSAITVNQDGSMRVENTITAVVTGDQIQHGIYYDFPTIYSNTKTGGRLVIDFVVLGAQRDGQTEPYTCLLYTSPSPRDGLL